ncbi:kinase-like domain-containing protein [Mycena vulgaris]|nr:kinase-like domain-containing protein [Mycena vulgaris]
MAFNLSVPGARPLPTTLEELTESEIYWRDHYDWLKECGYQLRPRFRPGWIPSWKTDPRKHAALCEDTWRPRSRIVIDAVCTNDNSKVLLKKIEKDVFPYEQEIGEFLTSLGPSPQNHCVPILRTLQPPDDENLRIIVTPLLRIYDSLRFDTIGEAVEFFRQIFEGLQFMHLHHIAHRDCNPNNIMMDGLHLYPHGFHSDVSHQHLKPTSYSDPSHFTRTQRPVKYYFIDFGLSRQYDPSKGPPMEEIIQGGDKSAPEFHIPGNYYCDPFATDIYYLGNLIRQDFLEEDEARSVYGRIGFEFMRPLVSDMVHNDPTMRPKIDEVVARFQEIQKDLSSWKLRSRVIGQHEYPYLPHRTVKVWYHRIVSIIIRRPAVPVPSI